MQNQNVAKRILQATNHNGTKPPITNLRNIVMPQEFDSYLKFIADTSNSVDLDRLITPREMNDKSCEAWVHTMNFEPNLKHDTDLLTAVRDKIAEANVLLWPEFRDIKDAQRRLFITLANHRAADLARTGELAEAMLLDDPHQANRILEEKFGELDADLVNEAYAVSSELKDNADENYAKHLPTRITPHEQECLTLMMFEPTDVRFWLEWSLENYGFDVPVILDGTVSEITAEYNPRQGSFVLVPENVVHNGLSLLAANLAIVECRVRADLNSEALFHPYGAKVGLGHVDNSTVTDGLVYLKMREFTKEYLGVEHLLDPFPVIALDQILNDHRGFLEVACDLGDRIRKAHSFGQLYYYPWEDAYYCVINAFSPNSSTKNLHHEDELAGFLGAKSRFEGALLAEDLAKNDLSHWLELGGFTPDELVQIANVVDFRPELVPYRFKDTTDAMARIFLADEP